MNPLDREVHFHQDLDASNTRAETTLWRFQIEFNTSLSNTNREHKERTTLSLTAIGLKIGCHLAIIMSRPSTPRDTSPRSDMDTALQNLTNTLEAINARQAAARKRARKGGDATPFTSAVLNREGLEIYTYIRDADPQTEANLFWYPPLPQASRAGPSSSSHRSAHGASGRTNGASHMSEDVNEADLLLAPRLPEPRHVAPPTPLRNTASANKQNFQSQGDPSVDPRVLLLAAQRLNDTCGKGSRTRKHIKGLLKTHASLNQDIKSYEQQIRQSEAQLRATTEGKPIGNSQLSSATSDAQYADSANSATSQVHAHISEVQDSIHKEQLEILALEEMITELRQARLEWQKQELQRQQTAEASSEPDRILSQEQPTPRRALPRASLAKLDHVDASAQEAAQDSSLIAYQDDQELVDSRVNLSYRTEQQEEVEEEEQVHQIAYSSEPQHSADQDIEQDISIAREHRDASISQSHDDAADLTVQQQQQYESHDAREEIADTSAAMDPVELAQEPTPASRHSQASHLLEATTQSSQELERVTAKVWEVFGDALRSVAPERESADYYDTLDILKSLMAGGDKPNAGDYSVGSVQTSSTLSTAASEASAAASAQLTPEVLMTAFVIFQMLVSEEPHRMNIDELKVRGHEWWSTSGMQVWLHARSHDETDVPVRAEAFEDGQNLARKATYGMISKQLFAIKRQKGVGLVGFA